MTATEKKALLSQVDQSLDSLRPYLKNDGGDIAVHELTEDYVLQVKLLGACQTCPQSYMTMKAGIEESVKKAIPQIKSVVAV